MWTTTQLAILAVPLLAAYFIHSWTSVLDFWLPKPAPKARPRTYCPPPGPSLPPPIIANGTTPPLDLLPTLFEKHVQDLPLLSNTIFAVRASIGNTPILEFAHPLPGFSGASQSSYHPGYSTRLPLFETKFRIASMTKLFTVLAVLLSKEKIGWEDPITRFVQGLDESVYGEVTIAALAGQTSGLGRFGYVGDLAFIPGVQPAMLGIPAVNNTLPGCDPFPGGRVCTRDEALEMFNHPAYQPHSPNSGPLYSNIAYNLLGMALESVHSKPFEQVVQDLILSPVGMTQSAFETPKGDELAVLPKNGERWHVPDFGNFNPAGGLWSTADDMLRFLQALQSHRLLSPAETRRWLQPRALLPSLHQLVGAPWEIIRPTNLDIEASRPIDIYTKAGGVAGYAGYAILVPEYDIAVTIHAAGNSATAATEELLPLIIRPLIAYADEQARLQAASKYVGTYTVAGSNSTIILALDDGPGIAITSFVMNGVAVLASLAALSGGKSESSSARLFPTDPDSVRTARETWRILFDRTKPENSFADLGCVSWNWGDPFRYMREPLDTVVFEFDAEKAVQIELLGWRTTLTREAKAR